MTARTEVARIVVDPNGSAFGDVSLSSSFFSDATRIPAEGEAVCAVQPDGDDVSFSGAATVERIDSLNRLIYLRVDWASFASENSVPLEAQEGSDADGNAIVEGRSDAPWLLEQLAAHDSGMQPTTTEINHDEQC